MTKRPTGRQATRPDPPDPWQRGTFLVATARLALELIRWFHREGRGSDRLAVRPQAQPRPRTRQRLPGPRVRGSNFCSSAPTSACADANMTALQTLPQAIARPS